MPIGLRQPKIAHPGILADKVERAGPVTFIFIRALDIELTSNKP